MKLIFFTLLAACLTFTTYAQNTNEQRIDRVNEILVSTFPENYLLVEKAEIEMNGCELVYIEHLNNNRTREERHDLKTSDIDLVDFIEGTDEFGGPFWTIEINASTIGFDIHDRMMAIEMFQMLLQLRKYCE